MDRGTRPAPAVEKEIKMWMKSSRAPLCQTGTLEPAGRAVDVCRAAGGRRAWDAPPVRAKGHREPLWCGGRAAGGAVSVRNALAMG